MKPISNFFVYILLCKDGSYYTGYTQDLEVRLKQHMSGRGSKYTKKKKAKKIVYIEFFTNRSDAMKREKEIKSLTHKDKTNLIYKKFGNKNVLD